MSSFLKTSNLLCNKCQSTMYLHINKGGEESMQCITVALLILNRHFYDPKGTSRKTLFNIFEHFVIRRTPKIYENSKKQILILKLLNRRKFWALKPVFSSSFLNSRLCNSWSGLPISICLFWLFLAIKHIN
jgi:hypothetical protein